MSTFDADVADRQARYSRGAILLHWLIALSIIVNWLIGKLAEGMPKPREEAMMGFHVALGVTVLILSVIRVAWRITHKPPPPNPDHARWERVLASAIHKLFYFLIIALPLTGYLMVQYGTGGWPIDMFGLFDFPALPVVKNHGTHEVFEGLHGTLANIMLVLFLLHVAGAWKHQLLDRDGTIYRMLPFGHPGRR
jgi:cytochrome b561